MDHVTAISHSATELKDIFGVSDQHESGDERDESDVGDKLLDAINRVRATFNMDTTMCDDFDLDQTNGDRRDTSSAGADEKLDSSMSDITDQDRAKNTSRDAPSAVAETTLGLDGMNTNVLPGQTTALEESKRNDLQPQSEAVRTEGTGPNDELYDPDDPVGDSPSGDEPPERQGRKDPPKKVKSADGSWSAVTPKKPRKNDSTMRMEADAPPGPPGDVSTKPKEPNKAP